MDTVLVDPFFPAIRSFLNEDGIKEWVSLRTPGVFEAFEKGEISEREYFRRFYTTADLPPHIPPIARIKKRMFGSVSFRPGMNDLLQDLSDREDLVLALASNYSAWYHTVLKRRPELESYFRYLFFSCEMGVRKPDARYFEIIQEALQNLQKSDPSQATSFESIWFFDDRPANLRPARRMGWNAHPVEIQSADPADARSIQEEILSPLRQAGLL